MQSFITSAATDRPSPVFGATSFLWMGEHGSLPLDNNEQCLLSFIEEIHCDYAAIDATVDLITAGS